MVVSCNAPNVLIVSLSRCGICVGGTTGLGDSSGVNECGECVALSAHRQTVGGGGGSSLTGNKQSSCGCGELVDDCGVCREKDSREWSSKQ